MASRPDAPTTAPAPGGVGDTARVVPDDPASDAAGADEPAGEAAGAADAGGHALRRFRQAYAEHRAAEGRGAGGEAELLALPYLSTGPQAGQWAVRSRTFDRFLEAVLRPAAEAAWPRPLRVLDLGAGNGWLSWRLGQLGHHAVAMDVRDDGVDGLGAAAGYRGQEGGSFPRVAASFEALPLAGGRFDMAVFNASLHYAVNLETALREAARAVTRGGRIAILDSPFYAAAEHGEAMVREKRASAAARFGALAPQLTAPPFVEYLTEARLEAAAPELGLRWRRHRVRYPLRYELRPLRARVLGRRPPSRFDLWEAVLP